MIQGSFKNLLKLCKLIKLYIKYHYAKMYGDSILYAHVTAAQSLHVQKVRIMLIHDFE